MEICGRTSRLITPYSEWNFILCPPFLSNRERTTEAQSLTGWELTGYDDSHWENAVFPFRPAKMLPMKSPWNLATRPILDLP